MLLKQLMLQRMENGGDVRDHVRHFFDAIDKLGEMEVDIHPRPAIYHAALQPTLQL